jgi:CTP synthase
MSKYIFCLGSVYSGCGKGVSVASIGMLLKARGHNVNLLKCDGYINTEASVLSPTEHGETWVTNDGKECDLDLGHYERLCGIETNKNTIFTSGLLYKEIIEEHENGVYLGQTIQLQHVTNKVKDRIAASGKEHDVTVVEIGGVIGDVEAYTFLEAVRYFQQKFRQDVLVIVVAPVIWVSTIKEFKTKPLQNGIKELQKAGIQADIMLCRSSQPIPDKILEKISDLTNINRSAIFPALDVKSIYQVPIEFYNNNLDDLIVDMLRLPRSSCRISKYKEVVEKLIDNNFIEINIGVVYKYDNVDEAYLSVKEALTHAGIANDVKIKIHWIKSDELEQYKDGRGLHKFFNELDGVIVPGGFGARSTEGKIKSIQYVREKKIPFLGICLGLQCAVIEFARNVCKLENANSTEFNANTQFPVVNFVEGQKDLVKKSGTLRLGIYDCELKKDSLSYESYGKKNIQERHRHRYEVNPQYIEQYEINGLKVSGKNPETKLVEIMELDTKLHPFFVGVQFHPEYKSKLTEPAPLFKGLVAAAKKYSELHVKT